MNDKPEGWYYVGDGKLRYRDDCGWIDYYMDTSDPHAREWPPPTPKALLAERQNEEAREVRPSERPRRRVFHWPGRRDEPSPR